MVHLNLRRQYYSSSRAARRLSFNDRRGCGAMIAPHPIMDLPNSRPSIMQNPDMDGLQILVQAPERKLPAGRQAAVRSVLGPCRCGFRPDLFDQRD